MCDGKNAVRVPVVLGIGAQNVEPSEPWMMPALERLCAQKDGAVLDVGVNLGQTLVSYLSLGLGVPYVGFEPNPHCVHHARLLASRNGARNVTIVPYGLATEYRSVMLHARSDIDSAASLVAGFRDASEYAGASVVAVAPGDDLIEMLGVDDVSVLKIDVEGAELDVLSGLRRTITRTRPFILCEILPIYDETTANGAMRRARTDAVVALLREWNYAIFRQHHDGAVSAREGIETHGDIALSDYLLVPREREDALFGRRADPSQPSTGRFSWNELGVRA